MLWMIEYWSFQNNIVWPQVAHITSVICIRRRRTLKCVWRTNCNAKVVHNHFQPREKNSKRFSFLTLTHRTPVKHPVFHNHFPWRDYLSRSKRSSVTSYFTRNLIWTRNKIKKVLSKRKKLFGGFIKCQKGFCGMSLINDI